MRNLFVWLLFIGAVAFSRACLNDVESIKRTYAPSSPEAIIVGAFTRMPSEYYELRVRNLEQLRGASKLSLDQYDDLAVAYEKLGKTELALKRIEEKIAAMDGDGVVWPEMQTPKGMPVERYLRYSSLANRGTFRIHLWMKRGNKQETKTLIENGISDLEKAVKINPDAHSGREWAQIAIAKWLAGGPDDYPDFSGKSSDVIVNGLLGLVELGSAWESPDIYAMVSREAGHQPIGTLAKLRFDELLASGKKPITDLKPKLDSDANDEARQAYFKARKRADETVLRQQSYVRMVLANAADTSQMPSFQEMPKFGPIELVVERKYSNPWKTYRPLAIVMALFISLAVLITVGIKFARKGRVTGG